MNNTDYAQLARGLAGLALRVQTPETEKVASFVSDMSAKLPSSSGYMGRFLVGRG